MALWRVVFIVITCAIVSFSGYSLRMADHSTKRSEVLDEEARRAAGGSVPMSDKERRANEVLLEAKSEELTAAKRDVHTFLPARNFLEVAEDISRSKVYKILKKLPKGGLLHVHLFASVSFKYVFNDLTYRDNLYFCDGEHQKLRFMSKQGDLCRSLADERKNDPDFDKWLRRTISLTKEDVRCGIHHVWNRFRKILTATYDIFTYKPVFIDYVTKMLEELYEDNVFYVEVRSPFVELYDLDGTTYGGREFINIFQTTVHQFKNTHPKFVGAKFIYAIYRKLNEDALRRSLEQLGDIMAEFPDFIVGFDFVGFEEDAPLRDHVHQLSELDLSYFFHAGETNWNGADVDNNLVDAVLLGAKRIGHAFALFKHPRVKEIVREKDIAVEVNPISNQVLKLVSDLRNHPANYLIAEGFPIVICNDDPGNWGAEGLSYDWYEVFMAMTSEASGLGFLKEVAMNSIRYSGMSPADKAAAMEKWEVEWEKFVDDLVAERKEREVSSSSI